MKYLILKSTLLTWGLTTPVCEASTYRLLDVDRVDLVASRLRPTNRDPYAPELTGVWGDRAALEWDLRLLEYGYWRNNVHTETAGKGGTVRTVGWEWEAGVEIGNYFDIFYHHHSRHIMEAPAEDRFDSHNDFPVEDSVGLRIHLLRKK